MNTSIIPTEEELYRMFVIEKMTKKDICSVYNFSLSILNRLLREYGISRSSSIDEIKSNELRIISSMTVAQVADYFGISGTKLYSCIKYQRDKAQHGKSCESCDSCKGDYASERLRMILSRMPEYNRWRTAVFKRDRYTCQECGARCVPLEAHHILPYRDYPELAFEIDNGITLCEGCHYMTRGREYDYVSNYTNIVKSRSDRNMINKGICEMYYKHHGYDYCDASDVALINMYTDLNLKVPREVNLS